MKESDIAIVRMPQADGLTKNRPAVLLREMPPFRDMLVCGTGPQLHQEVNNFDEIISPNNPNFTESSLMGKSLI